VNVPVSATRHPHFIGTSAASARPWSCQEDFVKITGRQYATLAYSQRHSHSEVIVWASYGTWNLVRHDQRPEVFLQATRTRIAELRKERGLTQVQLAEMLDLTQQMVASYEVGRRRVPVSLLPSIATALAVPVEELIGQGEARPAKRGPALKLQQQIERIGQLPKAKQRFVMEMLDTVLAQASR